MEFALYCVRVENILSVHCKCIPTIVTRTSKHFPNKLFHFQSAINIFYILDEICKIILIAVGNNLYTYVIKYY